MLEHTSGDDAETTERAGWRRLWHAFWHPGRGQFMIAAILCVVAIMVAMQVRTLNDDAAYTNTRREDLVTLLDGLNEESQRLESEIAELENTKRELESGGDAREVARVEAERRADTLEILNGTAPAIGTGIRVSIHDPNGKVTAQMLLNAVQELRDAGAEAVEINDTIRVVESTWFGGAPGDLVASEQALGRTIVIEAIGDPDALEGAVNFRGGVRSQVTAPDVGATLQLSRGGDVQISSVHERREPRYAQPMG